MARAKRVLYFGSSNYKLQQKLDNIVPEKDMVLSTLLLYFVILLLLIIILYDIRNIKKLHSTFIKDTYLRLNFLNFCAYCVRFSLVFKL